MQFLSQFTVKSVAEGYPFIPLVVKTPVFDFHKSVTVICGDNGCGKTTFAKLLATACNCVCVSYEKTTSTVFTENAKRFAFTRRFKPKRSFYFSAEEFVQFVRDVEERKQDAVRAIEEINADTVMSDYAKVLARSPHMETLLSFEDFYGVNLAEVSHGQSFLAFFDKRLKTTACTSSTSRKLRYRRKISFCLPHTSKTPHKIATVSLSFAPTRR